MKNNYWISNSGEWVIYRKGTWDDEPAVPFHTGVSNIHYKADLTPFMNDDYLICYGYKTLAVVQVKDDYSKGVEGLYKEDDISSVAPLNGENKFIFITRKNKMTLLEVIVSEDDIQFKKIDEIHVEGVSGKGEIGENVIVDSRNRYVITGQSDSSNIKNSNVSVYELDGDSKFRFKAIVRTHRLKMMHFFCFDFVKYYQNSFVVFGVSNDENDHCVVIAYDVDQNVCKLVKKGMIKFDHKSIYQSQRNSQGGFDMIDNAGRIHQANFD